MTASPSPTSPSRRPARPRRLSRRTHIFILRLNRAKMGEKSISVRPAKRPDNAGTKPTFNKEEGEKKFEKRNNQEADRNGGGFRERGPMKCFKCQEEGHMSRNCPSAEGGDTKPRGPMKCFKCQEEGHMSRNCPNNAEGGDRPPRNNDRPPRDNGDRPPRNFEKKEETKPQQPAEDIDY